MEVYLWFYYNLGKKKLQALPLKPAYQGPSTPGTKRGPGFSPRWLANFPPIVYT